MKTFKALNNLPTGKIFSIQKLTLDLEQHKLELLNSLTTSIRKDIRDHIYYSPFIQTNVNMANITINQIHQTLPPNIFGGIDPQVQARMPQIGRGLSG